MLTLAVDDVERLAAVELEARAYHAAVHGDEALAAYRDALGARFDAVINRLLRTGDHPLSRFTPGRATVPAGLRIAVGNAGGEFPS